MTLDITKYHNSYKPFILLKCAGVYSHCFVLFFKLLTCYVPVCPHSGANTLMLALQPHVP